MQVDRIDGAEPYLERSAAVKECQRVRLVHVSDVKEARLLSSPFMTFSHTQIRVLNRHGVPCKGDHGCAIGHM